MRSSRTLQTSPNASRKAGHPDPAVLATVLRSIVDVAAPETIILFGSGARGTMTADSDLDLLVIKGGKVDRLGLSQKIYGNLKGDISVDVVVATPEDIERYRNSECLVICPAMREGRVVYESKAMAAGRRPRMAGARPQQSRSRGKRPARS